MGKTLKERGQELHRKVESMKKEATLALEKAKLRMKQQEPEMYHIRH